MSDVRLRESLLPGLGHARRGFARVGWRFFLYATVWLVVVIGRAGTIAEIAADPSVENVLAIAFLALFPFGLVALTHRSLRQCVAPPSKEGMGTWALALRDFKRRPRGVWGVMFLVLLYMVAFLCPVLAPYDPYRTPRDTAVNKFRAPGETVLILGDTARGEVACLGVSFDSSSGTVVLDRGPEFPSRSVPLSRLGEPKDGWRWGEPTGTLRIGSREVPYRGEFHLVGTDKNGRDLLSRIIYGSRISLSIGFAAMAVAVTIGIVFGAIAGFFGGLIDGVIMRFVDILLAFPRLLLLLLIITFYQGAGIFVVVLILGLTGWMGVARLVRAQFLQLRELDYTTAARALGTGRTRLMFRHLLPNAMAPVIVAATLRVGDTILVEAALSFLGFGVRPPTPTWGNIVNDGGDALSSAWWVATLPGLAIVVTVVCFNLVGDTLRDVLDPRQRV